MQPIGRLTLNANPTNFFAETEQVAFHLGNLVPGIDVTNDPLLQARLFSYLDTQLTRLGGPNFAQIPINRPHAPVNDMLRDGFHQHAVHGGVAPYKPNSLDGGCPFFAGADDGAFVDVPVRVAEATKVRGQPGVVRRPLQPGPPVLAEHDPGREGAHRPGLHLRARQVLRAGDQGAPAAAPGEHRPGPVRSRSPPVSACRRRSRPSTLEDVDPSPALSQVGGEWPADGRMVGIVVDPDGDLAGVGAPARDDRRRRAWCRWSSPRTAATVDGMPVQRTFADRPLGRVRRAAAGRQRRSPAPDALPARDEQGRRDGRPPSTRGSLLMLEECWRHAKAIGAWGDGRRRPRAPALAGRRGVVTGDDAAAVFAEVQELMAAHRVWERFPATSPERPTPHLYSKGNHMSTDAIQRGRLTPAHRHFGSATSRTREPDATPQTPTTVKSLLPQQPFSTEGCQIRADPRVFHSPPSRPHCRWPRLAWAA